MLSLFLLGLAVFIAGCAQGPQNEVQFKNDVVTIENYFVSNVAPYENGNVNIEFEIHNNGDQKIPYLEVEFFDLPGFVIDDGAGKGLDCNEPIGERIASKCIFTAGNALEPLDARGITVKLKSTEDVSSPTPHAVSFAVVYTYTGSRDVSIPVIDGQTRKQPLAKFRQNDPSVGPVVLDVDPSIEREILAGDTTIRERWAIGGKNPLPFLAKFKFDNVGTVPKVKDVNITLTSLRLKLSGLGQEELCDFCDITKSDCKDNFNKIKTGLGDSLQGERKYFYGIAPSQDFLRLDISPIDYNLYSTKSVHVPFDTLICAFKPSIIDQPEYSAGISAFFAYKYEFIKSQNFVIQPLPG